MKKTLLYSCFLLLVTYGKSSFSQCTISASAVPATINCGDSISPLAIADAGTYVTLYENNFNTSDPGPGWTSANANLSFTNPCQYAGDGGDGTPHLWVGSGTNPPRQIATVNYNVARGGRICFDMKYARCLNVGAIQGPECTPGAAGDCEAPDLPPEGVYFQYSTNNGVTWVTIQYWDPTVNNAALIRWNNYCVNIPAAAATANTRFRWFQDNTSGSTVDHWGIDNVRISVNPPGFRYIWSHSPVDSPNPGKHAPGGPTYTYYVTYTDNNGISCNASVTVNVTMPSVTASGSPLQICPGASVQLDNESSLKANPPGTCGLSAPAVYCDPIKSQVAVKQIGTGTSVNTSGNCNENIFGTNNCGGGVRSQILYRAADLNAAGITGGKIMSLQFELNSVSGGNLTEMTIKMGCTNATELQPFGGTFLPGVSSVVFNTKAVNLVAGWNEFVFDNYYDWTGTTNLVVEICFKKSSGESTSYTRNTATGYAAVATAGTNGAGGSSWNCSTGTSFYRSYNFRPNTRFKMCEPSGIPLIYNWGPATNLTSTTIRNPVATPTVSTVYTVSVYESGKPQCASLAQVPINVITPIANINPSTATVCPPGTPGTVLTGSGTSGGTGPFPPVSFTNSDAQTIPDNNPAGITKNIEVNGINPATVGANPIVSVCMNITHSATQDLDIRLRAPNGTVIELSTDNGGTGNNYTNTCFTSGAGTAVTGGASPFTGNFRPETAFSPALDASSINGTWSLLISDDSDDAPLGVNNGTGSFVNWTISFNHTGTNSIVKYDWTPAASVSNPSVPNPTVSPTATTTYTVKVTDALGCTGTTTAIVGYCAAVPLDLLSLKAVKNNEKVDITWETSSERNASHFIVERSEDGIVFIPIGRVEAAGNSIVSSAYSFTDNFPGIGVNFYRLRFVEQSSAFSLSRVVSVSFSGAFFFVGISSPSPNGKVVYTVHSDTEMPVKVTVFDISGRRVFERDIQLLKGTNSIEEDISAFGKGVYLLRLDAERQHSIIRRFAW
jgi:subtilisin-like proprotein convertase family protein